MASKPNHTAALHEIRIGHVPGTVQERDLQGVTNHHEGIAHEAGRGITVTEAGIAIMKIDIMKIAIEKRTGNVTEITEVVVIKCDLMVRDISAEAHSHD